VRGGKPNPTGIGKHCPTGHEVSATTGRYMVGKSSDGRVEGHELPSVKKPGSLKMEAGKRSRISHSVRRGIFHPTREGLNFKTRLFDSQKIEGRRPTF